MTATVNAACASTHILIPTILDDNSTTATVNTVKVFDELRQSLSPNLNFLGILPTFIQYQTRFVEREEESLALMKDELAIHFKHLDDIHIFEKQRVLRKEDVAKSASGDVAFFQYPEIRNMYTELGSEIVRKLDKRFSIKGRYENTGVENGVTEVEQEPVRLAG